MAKLPILMYHNVCKENTNSKGLTISKSKLEEQFSFLQSNGYTSLHFSDIETSQKSLVGPKKPIIITFDDVYETQLELAYPLLKKYNLKASFFIPFAYVGGYDDWNEGQYKLMTVSQLKSLDSNFIELGLHSYKHGFYDKMTLEDIEKDFKNCQTFINEQQLDIKNILAYPYGKFPRQNSNKKLFFETLSQQKIAYALRIGNRLNTWPLKTNYELNRLDIKGDMSLSAFKIKLKFGKILF